MDWKRELEEHQADSLSVAVIRNFQIADTVAQGDGVTAHTRFQAASVSKMVFAAAVLRLAAEGRLSLEDDIGRYLGELPLHNAEGRPARATVRQVLAHTAGFGVHGFYGYGHGEELPTTAQIVLGEPPTRAVGLCCCKTVWRIFRGSPLPILWSGRCYPPLRWGTAPTGRM